MIIESIKQLKKERPDLIEIFEPMSKKQLLKQVYRECLDAINMETRVQLL